MYKNNNKANLVQAPFLMTVDYNMVIDSYTVLVVSKGDVEDTGAIYDLLNSNKDFFVTDMTCKEMRRQSCFDKDINAVRSTLQNICTTWYFLTQWLSNRLMKFNRVSSFAIAQGKTVAEWFKIIQSLFAVNILMTIQIPHVTCQYTM